MVAYYKKFIIFILLLVPFTEIRGQESLSQLTGRVADAKNMAIKGAVCKLKNDKDSILTYAITDVKAYMRCPSFKKENSLKYLIYPTKHKE